MIGSPQRTLYGRVRSYRRGANIVWASILEARKSPRALLSFCTMVLILIITLIVVGLLAGASLPDEGEKGFSFRATFLRVASVGSFFNNIFFRKSLDDSSLLIDASEVDAEKNLYSKINSKTIEIALASSNNVIHLHYLEAGPDSATAPVLILLHGNAFTAQTWIDIGTINVFSSSGVKVYAFDLPGHGETAEKIGTKEDRETFLLQVYDKLKIPKSSFIVSPSMSGRYSLPFLVQHTDKFAGYIPISPSGIELYADKLKEIELPTLILWGERDNVDKAKELSKLLKNSRLEIFPQADHPCYLQNPSLFHNLLLTFIKKVSDF